MSLSRLQQVGSPLTSDQVKQVKEALDIVEVIGNYLPLRPAGPTFKGLCPFHDDSRPSFDVDPRRQRYRCWACGKYGDVISFVQEREHVGFREALEMLARKAGIALENDSPVAAARREERSHLFEVIRWAADAYQQCLLDTDSELADAARRYLGERKLLGPTIRKFGVGFAPLALGDWLVKRAVVENIDFDALEKVGLIGRRTRGPGWYDRFRDRVMFPIRDPLGRTIGFGGRILPESPLASRAPKYYNSPDTPLFSKSEHVFGLDMARTSAGKEGFLAVVEGYTDVLMAHQCGVANCVATMGTALTSRHVHHLRRFVPRVVLVYDADAGGHTGVDRALEIFVSQDVDLSIATLPDGLDPCDLLIREGGLLRFKEVLASATDALDFKLTHLLGGAGGMAPLLATVEGRRRAIDTVLRIIALAPELPGQAGAVKQELIVTRISQRLTLKEETIWARLNELRQQQQAREPRRPSGPEEGETDGEQPRKAKAAPEEQQLLQLLLADPVLVPEAQRVVRLDDMGHPGLRNVLRGLYEIHDQGRTPTLDDVRARLESPALSEWLIKLHDVGAKHRDRSEWLRQVLSAFQSRRVRAEKQELQNQLQAASDNETALELLRQLQQNP